MINDYFKSLIECDSSEIVICDLSHTILYCNKVAKERYLKHGDLVGKNLLDCHSPKSREAIKKVVNYFLEDKEHNKVFTFRKEFEDIYMIALRREDGTLIGYYEKHENKKRETAEPYGVLNKEG